MALVTSYPTGYANESDTVYNLYAFIENADNPIPNAFDDSEKYALLQLQSSNETGLTSAISLKGFDFSRIPLNATISSIMVAIRYKLNALESFAWMGGAVYSGDLVNPTEYNMNGATTEHSEEHSANVFTREQLEDVSVDIYATHNINADIALLYLYSVSVTVEYTEIPTVTLGTPTRTRISAVSGHDQAMVTFTSDVALSQWEARATLQGQTAGHGSGLLVESGGSLEADTETTVTIDNEELTNGDAEYTISIFGQSVEGRWSDG